MGPAAAQSPVPAEEFVGRLEAARSVAEDAVADPSPVAWSRVRGILDLPTSIVVAGEVREVPDLQVFEDFDPERGADFRRLAVHLEVLAEEIDATDSRPVRDRAQILTLVHSAYAGIERESPGMLDRLRQAIGTFLFAILDAVARTIGSGWGFLPTLLLILLSLGTAFFLWRFVVRLGLVEDRNAPRSSFEETAGETDWRAVAEGSLARGDMETAVRAYYSLLVASLAAHGVIQDDRTLTSGECRLIARRMFPERSNDVDRACLIFERVAYGGGKATSSDVEAVRTTGMQLRAA